jgi:hypothetical protein
MAYHSRRAGVDADGRDAGRVGELARVVVRGRASRGRAMAGDEPERADAGYGLDVESSADNVEGEAMKDVRFYLEFPSRTMKHKSGRANTGHSGNVFALFLEGDPVNLEGLGGVFSYPNSPVACTGTSREFLTGCKRISERLAREIHPALFERLDVGA